MRAEKRLETKLKQPLHKRKPHPCLLYTYVSVRTRGGEDLGAMSRADFAARVLDDVKTKRIW